jgi:hypothetical protein
MVGMMWDLTVFYVTQADCKSANLAACSFRAASLRPRPFPLVARGSKIPKLGIGSMAVDAARASLLRFIAALHSRVDCRCKHEHAHEPEEVAQSLPTMNETGT